MNRYPAWKYILIAVAIVIGFVYTLPNFFPEVPAVQVSTSKATVKVDAGTLATVEGTLKDAGIAHRGATVDTTGVKVRLADTDTQLKAKDVLQKRLGDDYIVALNLISSSPQWLASIGALPMYLGLDLRGGVHFLLQIDMKGAIDKAADRYTTDIRSLMREKRVQYGGVSREGQNVVLRFREEAERAKARIEIEKSFPDLMVREQEAAGGELRLVASLKPEAQKRIQDGAVQQNITILRNRVNELGVSEPIVQQQGAERIVVQLPGVQDTARAKDILGRTATLEIRMVNEDPGALEAAIAGQVPFGSDLFTERGGQPVLVKRQVVLTGDRINDAQPGFDQRTNEPAVHVNLDGSGGRIFKEVTRENVGKRMAIVLVEKGKAEVITAPVIREEIGGGRVQISGRMSTREANDVALLMRAGALAAPMDIVEERTVGPSLGKENIEKGFNSVVYGFVALAVFMCAYYMLMGARLDDRARHQRAVADRTPVDAAGDAHAAGHRGDRAHARHGDRRQRADQRAHPRGAALGRDAARRDPGGLRARLGHDPRLQHHDADRRHRAPDLRQRPGARLRGRPLPRHPHVDVLGGAGIARHRQPDLRQPPQARQDLDRPGLEARARHRLPPSDGDLRDRGAARRHPRT